MKFVFFKKGEHGRVISRGCDVVVIEGLPSDETSTLLERLFRRVRKRGPEEAAPATPAVEKPVEEVRGDGYVVTPPAGWTVKRREKFGRIIMQDSKSKARIELGTLALPAPSPPEEVAKSVQQELPRKLPGYELIDTETGTSRGQKAVLLKFEGEDPESGSRFRYFMVVMTKGKKALIATLASPVADYERPAVEARKVMESFRWLD